MHTTLIYQKSSKLKELTLGHSKLGKEAFHIVTEMLRNNFPRLTFLAINSEDVISDKGMLLQLLDVVRLNNTLEIIHLAHNTQPDLFKINQSTTSSYSSTSMGVYTDTESVIQEIQKVVKENVEARSNNAASSKASPSMAEQQTGLQERIDKARELYAQGKGAYYTNNKLQSITFFQQAKDIYKDITKDSNCLVDVINEANNRLEKIKNPNGKYSPIKLGT